MTTTTILIVSSLYDLRNAVDSDRIIWVVRALFSNNLRIVMVTSILRP